MKIKAPFAAALLVTLGLVSYPATPIAAQGTRAGKILTIFGNDKCPTSGGEEIVVCQRLDENERYRIPKDLRDSGLTGKDAWNERARSFEYVGQSGTNSCSPVGVGGASGCYDKLLRGARA